MLKFRWKISLNIKRQVTLKLIPDCFKKYDLLSKLDLKDHKFRFLKVTSFFSTIFAQHESDQSWKFFIAFDKFVEYPGKRPWLGYKKWIEEFHYFIKYWLDMNDSSMSLIVKRTTIHLNKKKPAIPCIKQTNWNKLSALSNFQKSKQVFFTRNIFIKSLSIAI
jgi:hypothetical protein